tara:strand:- start:491 stop:2281 length:1791 start_codon:yes stop_codon:yes gene_type:complete
MFYSCETMELEDLASPNSLSPDLADADLLLNKIQISFLSAMQDMQYNGAALGRISYMGGRVYYNNFGAYTVSSSWYQLYASILPDIAAIEGLNGEENLLAFHLGMSKAMAAHIMMGIVDSVGDIPWAEANNPVEYPNPGVSDDADVYAAAVAMLDEAQGYLDAAGGGDDMYYGGDASKWTKYVNTLKMRAALTQGNYSAALAQTNVIETAADDLQFNYGSQELQPDTRHPWYGSDYTTSGANIYQSSWLMDLMDGETDDWYATSVADWSAGNFPINDPRRRYYFYRQTTMTPGNHQMIKAFGAVYMYPYDWSGDSSNGETLQCSLQDQPFHLEFTPDGNTGYGNGRWCSNFIGYWGRHHGNDEGTPPDNFTRTATGVYPSGGSFDNLDDIGDYDTVGSLGGLNALAGQVWQGNGGGGAGIWPIYLSSYVKFMKAEAALATGDAATAAMYMEAGMNESITKVMGFSSVDAEADSSKFPTSADVAAFVSDVMAQFAAAPTTSTLDGLGWPVAKSKWDLLGEQYFVAMFGGANDAWNFMRRTGYPSTLSRGLMDEVESGPFPRTGTYPTSEISANPSILQRQDNNTLVFWDSGTTVISN